MKFPDLKTIAEYGIYSVEKLEKFYKKQLPKLTTPLLEECSKCAYVHEKGICTNCKLS